jgi:hypothetical protein
VLISEFDVIYGRLKGETSKTIRHIREPIKKAMKVGLLNLKFCFSLIFYLGWDLDVTARKGVLYVEKLPMARGCPRNYSECGRCLVA